MNANELVASIFSLKGKIFVLAGDENGVDWAPIEKNDINVWLRTNYGGYHGTDKSPFDTTAFGVNGDLYLATAAAMAIATALNP